MRQAGIYRANSILYCVACGSSVQEKSEGRWLFCTDNCQWKKFTIVISLQQTANEWFLSNDYMNANNVTTGFMTLVLLMSVFRSFV